MRFVTFEHKGRTSPGVLLDAPGTAPARVIDGSHPARPAPLRRLEPSMMRWIDSGLAGLSRALRQADIPGECTLPLADVRLLAPLPTPGKIVGAAFNYRDGLSVSGRAAPDAPVTFIKSRSTIIGPDDPIVLAPGNAVTYEAELAVIIGTQALRVPRSRAMAHVCGYAIFNDVSYTNLVRDDGTFVRGKNQATSGPFGPWILSADDLADPHDLAIGLEVDGEIRQSSSTREMLFRIDELIAFISERMPLDPGDIIATGTPAGVAANHTPAAWLRAGQEITLHIPGLGRLRNPVQEIPE